MTLNTSETLGQDTFSPSGLTIPYVLYLIGFIFPVAALAGLVFAYMQEPSGHRQFIIRTFWYGLLMSFIGGILTMVLVGWFILLLFVIWTLTRVFSGWSALSKGKDLANPKSLGFMAT